MKSMALPCRPYLYVEDIAHALKIDSIEEVVRIEREEGRLVARPG